MNIPMSNFITAVDKHTDTQYGENCHIEYTWSEKTQEKIQQLFFQLTRTKDPATLHNLSNTTYGLVKQIMSLEDVEQKRELGLVLYKIVAQTRDIVSGKGEYNLSYMLLYAWARVNIKLAKFALFNFVHSSSGEHPLGSWKDMKYFATYCHENGTDDDVTTELVKFVIELVNKQLRKDVVENKDENLSLLAKWIPREKSRKFGWLFNRLALDYYAHWVPNVEHPSHAKAVNKVKTHYRKMLSALNIRLDTIQIKQCDERWSHIKINTITSQTLQKQKYALQNIDKKGNTRCENWDRIKCADNYRHHLNAVKEGKAVMKGKRVGLVNFVKDALEALSNGHKDTINTVNEQWKNNATTTGKLGNFVAMADTSGSMTCDGCNPLHAALGLSIRVAEKSTFGKRVLTFSAHPEWINLEDCHTLTEMVDRIHNCNWGMNTNFHAAMKLILDAIVENKLPASDVKNMVLAVFSDMQIDSSGSTHTMMGEIERLYADAGRRICGEPYTPPHILFWNLRSSNGFPTLSTQPNASMMSGFSPGLLNLFCEKGLEGILQCTPWNMLTEALNNKRYDTLEEKFLEVVS